MTSIENPKHSNRVETARFSASKYCTKVNLSTLCSLSIIDCYEIGGNQRGTTQVLDSCKNGKSQEIKTDEIRS